MGDWWSGNAVESSSFQLRSIANDFEEKRTGAVNQLTTLSEFTSQYRTDNKGPDITTIAGLADAVTAGMKTTVDAYASVADAFHAAADTIGELNERESALRTKISNIDSDVLAMYTGSAYSYGGAVDTTAAERQQAVDAQAEYNSIRAAEDAALKTLAETIGAASTGDDIEVNDAAVQDILGRLVLEVTDPDLLLGLTIGQAVLVDGSDGEIDGTKENFETLIGNGATAEGAAKVVDGEYSTLWTDRIYEDGLLPRAVDVALEHQIAYGEAEYAVLGTEIEQLQYEIDNYEGDEPYTKTKLWVERNRRIDLLTNGDRGLAREFTALLNDGVSVDDAVGAAVREEYGDASYIETLEGTGLAYGKEYNATVFTFALQEQLYEKTEEALDTDFDDNEGPDFGDVDLGLLALAEHNDVSYNTMVAYIQGADPANRPEIYQEAPPGFLDLPITGGDEAAAILSIENYDDSDVFTEIETAKQGDKEFRDGKMSQEDIDAILADPDATVGARAVAQFLNDNPDAMNHIDVANDGRFLSGLGDGEYITAGDGDGTITRQEVQQFQLNRSIFTTLNTGRENGLIGDPDRSDGTYSEQALADVRANLTSPGEDGPVTDEEKLAVAIDVTLENHWLDNRSGWNKLGDGIASHGGVLGVGWELAGFHDDDPTNGRRLTNNPVGYVTDFGKGVGDFAVGIYDLSAAVPLSPAFHIERAREQFDDQFGDGDYQHRGVATWEGMGAMADTAQTFMPWTDDYDQAEEQRRRLGTSKISDARDLASSMVDFDTFVYEPGRFAGQVAPEVVLAAFTFGSSATASVARVTVQQGVRAGARHALKLVGNGTRAWVTAPSRVFSATSDGLGTILNKSRLKFKPDVETFSESQRVSRLDEADVESGAREPLTTDADAIPPVVSKSTDLDIPDFNSDGSPDFSSLDTVSLLDDQGRQGIVDYTKDDYYGDINTGLRVDPDGLSSELQRVVDDAIHGLDQLPVYGHSAPLYRGTNLPDDVYLELIGGAETYSDGAFLSSSTNRAVADGFASRHKPNPVIFKIEASDNGRVVGNASSYPVESEILFRPGTKFEIVRIDTSGSIPVVTMVES